VYASALGVLLPLDVFYLVTDHRRFDSFRVKRCFRKTKLHPTDSSTATPIRAWISIYAGKTQIASRLLASRYLSDWWNAITWMNYGLFAYNMMQYFSVGDKVPQRGKVELAATVKSEYVCSDRW
jgi:hypothetical protein